MLSRSPSTTAARVRPSGTSIVTEQRRGSRPDQANAGEEGGEREHAPEERTDDDHAHAGRPAEGRELAVDTSDDHEGDGGTRGEDGGVGDRIDVAQEPIGGEDVHRVDAGGREGKGEAEHVRAHRTATDEGDATEDRDERGEALCVQPLAPREGGDPDDDREMAVVEERRERRRGPLERGVEEERVGRVEHEPEPKGGQRHPKREREQRPTRDHAEHDGCDQVAPTRASARSRRRDRARWCRESAARQTPAQQRGRARYQGGRDEAFRSPRNRSACN